MKSNEQKKLKVLIDGSSGMLGTDILPILRKHFEIYAPSRNEMDIVDETAIDRIFSSNRFDWVIHLAASTDLDWCEDNPDEALRINAYGTKNMAEHCARYGVKMIYISTSGVFSGRHKKPYNENDIPEPANVYGKSKYLGEQFVRQILPEQNFLILRVGWLFGGGKNDKKFVGKMFNLIRERPKVYAVRDIFGSPNYSVDIGRTIVELIDSGAYGTFHIANSGEPASRYDVAKSIRDFADVETEVVPVPADKFPTKAFRPPMEAIESIKIEDVLGHRLRHWKDALEEYISRLKSGDIEYKI